LAGIEKEKQFAGLQRFTKMGNFQSFNSLISLGNQQPQGAISEKEAYESILQTLQKFVLTSC
jgi:hypothetical protein